MPHNFSELGTKWCSSRELGCSFSLGWLTLAVSCSENSMQVLAETCEAPVADRAVSFPLTLLCWQQWGITQDGISHAGCCQTGAQGEGKLFLHSRTYLGHSWERVDCCDLFCRKLSCEEAHGAAECMESVTTGAGRSKCWVCWHSSCNSSA